MMQTNAILTQIIAALDLDEASILEAYKLADYEMAPDHLALLLDPKKKKKCTYEELGIFLDGLVALKRGPSTQKQNDSETIPLTNNLILKKLRIALELKEAETEIVFNLADITLSKQQLSALFRKEGHKNYKACSNELLMSFLEGLGEFYYTGEAE